MNENLALRKAIGLALGYRVRPHSSEIGEGFVLVRPDGKDATGTMYVEADKAWLDAPNWPGEIGVAWQLVEYVTDPANARFVQPDIPTNTVFIHRFERAQLWCSSSSEAAERISIMFWEAMTGRKWEVGDDPQH
jgi:hypothetical protein